MRTPSRRLIPLALAIAAALAAAPAPAQLYKWVDEKGATHYSDRKPDDEKAAKKVKAVDSSTFSVYSPDKTLLTAVERARERASREPAPEPERVARPYMAPVNAPLPAQADPCAMMSDCEYYYPYAPGYAARRHGQPVNPAVLPAGATAGTINNPGIIPGNSGTTPTGTAGHPAPQRSVAPRPRPQQLEPERRLSAR